MTFPVRSAAITAIRRRADMVNSKFVTDDEIIDLANDNLELIWRECITAYGESVFIKETSLGLGPGGFAVGPWPTTLETNQAVTATRFPLPSDFERLVRAEWTEGVISKAQTLATTTNSATHGTATPFSIVTGAPVFDSLRFVIANGGTIGTPGITYQMSLNGGAYSPPMDLGTATGHTAAFAGGSVFTAFGTGTVVTDQVITVVLADGPEYVVTAQRQPLWYAMRPIDPIRMPRITEARTWVGQQPAYWVTGNMGPAVLPELANSALVYHISFWPLPATAVAVHIFYMPACPRYGASDGDSFVNLNQLAWSYVRDATAAQLLEKQRSDSSALQASAARAMAAVQTEQQKVDTNPRGTIDVYGYDGPRDELYEWR